jgi:hypothetical protein
VLTPKPVTPLRSTVTIPKQKTPTKRVPTTRTPKNIFNKPVKDIPQAFKIPPPPFKTDKKKKRRTEGFNVLVKSKGIFRQVNQKPLNKSDAINYGAYRVGTSASATFKLEKTSGKPVSFNAPKGNIQDFYTKKGSYIEKRGRRIKSLGELKEITYKGIAVNRAKGKSPFTIKKDKKNIWGFKK